MAGEHLEPWQKILWSQEIQQKIARDYGVYNTHAQNIDKAILYYNKALEIKGDDAKSLYYRSLCKKYMSLSKSSLEDAIAAFDNSTLNLDISLRKCDAMYDMNDFEHSGVELSNEMTKFCGHNKRDLMQHFEVIRENLSDSLGMSLHRFVLENKDHSQWRASQPDYEDKCDVVSIQEKVEELVHPRERARRVRNYRMFNQQCLKRSWIDVCFLKSLKENKALLLPQSTISSKLKDTIDSNYNAVIEFLKKLEARDPLYNINFNRWTKMEHETTLNRIQYRTKRQMKIVFDEARRLRSEGRADLLSKYLDAFMGDYLILKTNRIAPCKFEYLNEIYNTLGLAYLDELDVPLDLRESLRNMEKIHTLLRIPIQDESRTRFVFGQRNTWTEPEAIDNDYIRYKWVL